MHFVVRHRSDVQWRHRDPKIATTKPPPTSGIAFATPNPGPRSGPTIHSEANPESVQLSDIESSSGAYLSQTARPRSGPKQQAAFGVVPARVLGSASQGGLCPVGDCRCGGSLLVVAAADQATACSAALAHGLAQVLSR